jgi:23S rRNA (adenine2030-N6)-methyltransferase
MNYRHVFHAGNHADVFKHVVLLELLRLLLVKPTPIAYLESHAGAGAYALTGDAEKTGEWRDGIGRVWDAEGAPQAVARYLDAVRSWNEGLDGLRRYPGSPGLAADALRADDRIVLCETQNDIADELSKRLAQHDPRVRVIREDGYHNALKALMPPPERRGLVLVDPPYESQQAEFDVITSALRDALKRFATGTYAVWYPIKHAGLIAPFTRSLATLPAKSVIRVELWVRATDSPLRLNGSGMAIVNPPWPFAADVQQWMPWLSKRLAADRGAGWRSEWLKREASA